MDKLHLLPYSVGSRDVTWHLFCAVRHQHRSVTHIQQHLSRVSPFKFCLEIIVNFPASPMSWRWKIAFWSCFKCSSDRCSERTTLLGPSPADWQAEVFFQNLCSDFFQNQLLSECQVQPHPFNSSLGCFDLQFLKDLVFLCLDFYLPLVGACLQIISWENKNRR